MAALRSLELDIMVRRDLNSGSARKIAQLSGITKNDLLKTIVYGAPSELAKLAGTNALLDMPLLLYTSHVKIHFEQQARRYNRHECIWANQNW